MSKSKITILVVSVLLLVLTISIGYSYRNPTSSNTTDARTSETAPKDSPTNNQNQTNNQPTTQQPKSSISYVDSMAKDVALTVNGENFAREDFERRLHKTQFVFKANGLNFEDNSAEILQELEETVINELILERVVMQLAAEFKIVATDEEVQQRLAATKQNFSEEEWQALLESRGINEEHLNTYNKIKLTEVNLINWLGGEQQFKEYLDKKISQSKVTINKPLIKELVTKL